MNEIFKRVSVRKFTNNYVEDEKIEKILRAAMQAPSAGNAQPWEFIVVRNKQMLKKLANMSVYSKFIGDSSVAIVVLGNKERMRFPENWLQDLGATTQNILLEATSLGLGTVWATAAPLEDRMIYVRKVFNLEENILPYCVVPVGYADGKFEATDRYDENRIHYDKY